MEMKVEISETPRIGELIEHLDIFGYCVIEDAISVEQADDMARTFFQLHEGSANR